jgi:Structural protein gp24
MVASFQSTVSINQGFGVPGEQYTDSPWRAQTFTIVSASAAYNNIGSTCCSITADGICAAGNTGGTLPYAGLLVDPKNIALFGTGGIPLAPTLNVPNNTIVECATMGTFVVALPAAANVGDYVVYDNTTGAISTVAIGSSTPGSGKSWANAFVDYYSIAGAGLAVITMNPGVGIPTV